jgi:hypothetical protein
MTRADILVRKVPAKLRLALLGFLLLFLLALPQIYPKSYAMGVMCRIFMYSILA